MAKINPYIHFDGSAQEAFDFYKSVFGGEFAAVMRFGDAPDCGGMPIAESEKNKIMHIALPISDGDVLMATDRLEAMGRIEAGNNFSISISAESREEADRLFNGLSEGGKVEMPLADSSWNSYFGMLQDKFGVDWMVDYDQRSDK